MSRSLVLEPSSITVMWDDLDDDLERYKRDNLYATITITERVLEVVLEENDLFEEPVIPVLPLGTEMTGYEAKNSKNLSALRETLSEVLETDNKDLEIPISDKELVTRCLPRFHRGDYAGAAREAGQILEERVFSMSSLEETHGTDMFNQVLSPDGDGINISSNRGEQTGVMFLFSGYYQAIRNPLSHRRPDLSKDRFLDDLGEQQTHHVLCFADFLLSQLKTADR